jgi:hypothetical protein
MSQLKKLIILTPEQLRRLTGRDRELSDRYDWQQRAALRTASKQAPRLGSSQAYAQYRLAQDRYLQHAARERTEPLEMNIVDTSPTPQIPPAPQEVSPEDVPLQNDENAKPNRNKIKRAKSKEARQRPYPYHSPLQTRAMRKREADQWLRFR